MIDDFLLSLLTAPMADSTVTGHLRTMSHTDLSAALVAWLQNVELLDPHLRIDRLPHLDSTASVVLRIEGTTTVTVAFVLADGAIADGPDGFRVLLEHEASKCDAVVVLECLEADDPRLVTLDQCMQDSLDRTRLLVIEPAWAAALLVEQLRPLVWGLNTHSENLPVLLGGAAPSPYFDSGRVGTALGRVSIERSSDDFGSLMAAAMDTTGELGHRLRSRRQLAYPRGDVLFCSTFLPPVTHSVGALERFYRGMGASDEVCAMIAEKAADEERAWLRHVETYRRIDIYDRYALEEYLASPDYRQMTLTGDELEQQIMRLERLAIKQNYTMCLTPETVDVCFEIREDDEVRIGSDRRNKSLPKPGRISGLVLRDPDTAETFEREFWSLFRSTEPEFKDKRYVFDWIKERVARYAPPPTRGDGELFDYFLCYDRFDREFVRDVATELRRHQLKVWFDEWASVPGRPWQRTLESDMNAIRAAVVFVGADRGAPWRDIEVEAIVRRFSDAGRPLVVVTMADGVDIVSMPTFLADAPLFQLNDPSVDRRGAVARTVELLRSIQ